MQVLLENRRAKAEYSLLESFEAGIALLGGEVKMLRLKRGSLVGAYVRVIGGEAVLLNAQIPAYEFVRIEDYDPKRTRKLLMHKNEIIKLQEAQTSKGLAVIPTMIGITRNHIKVSVSIAKGKKVFERREELKKRDIIRDAERTIKERIR